MKKPITVQAFSRHCLGLVPRYGDCEVLSIGVEADRQTGEDRFFLEVEGRKCPRTRLHVPAHGEDAERADYEHTLNDLIAYFVKGRYFTAEEKEQFDECLRLLGKADQAGAQGPTL